MKQLALLARHRKNCRGSAAVEFAFAMPLMMGIILGSFEMGRMFWIDQAISHALSKTARHAMINPDDTNLELTSYFRTLPNAIDPDEVVLTYAIDTVNDIPFVTITATYPFEPVSGALALEAIPISNSMRVPRMVMEES